MSLFTDWDVCPEEFSAYVQMNPSLYGFLAGHIAELKLYQALCNNTAFSSVRKIDDHCATKGDFEIEYNGHLFTIESKSVKRKLVSASTGVVQCSASGGRNLVLHDGSVLHTTCLKPTDFDVLAVNLHNLIGKWEFVYVLATDLPRCTNKSYPSAARDDLLASAFEITYPTTSPYTHNLVELLAPSRQEVRTRPQQLSWL